MHPQDRRFRLAACLFLAFVIPLAACSDDSPTAPATGGEDGEVATVDVSPSEVDLRVGEEQPLDATPEDEDGNTVSGVEIAWSSSDTSVATVDAQGTVTARAEGDATITASARGADGQAETAVSASVPEHTVVVDSTEMELVSSDSEREEGVLRFQVAGGAEPDVEPDDILVGAEDGGFLRRVTTVDRTGDEVVAQTTQAALTEAVDAGTFSARTTFTLDEEPAVQAQGDVVWGPTRVASTAENVTVGGGEVNLDGLEIVDPTETLRVEVREGRLALEPTVDVGARIGFPATLEEFHTTVGGDLTFDFDVFAGMAEGADVSAEVPIITLKKPFAATLGPVPVGGTVDLTFVAGADASASSEVGLETGFSSSAGLRVGARYLEGDWEDILEPDASYDPLATELVTKAGMNLRTYVRPEVTVDFYTIAAPFIGAEPYLAGDAETSGTSLDLEVAAGMDAELGFTMDVLSLEVLDHQTQIVGIREVLVEESFDLSGEATVYGDVRDFQTLDAIAEATVALEQQDGGVSRTLDTDAEGAYSFEDLPPGTYRLEANHPDYKENQADNIEIVELSGGDVVRIDFALPSQDFGDPVGSVAGRVLDDAGAPIAGASVQISGGEQTNGVFKSTQTADDGTYTLSGIVLTGPDGNPIDSFRVIADNDGFDAEVIEEVVIEENSTTTDVDFTLSPSTGVDVFFEDGFEEGLGWDASGFWNRSTGEGIVNEAHPTYVSLAPDDDSEGSLPTASEGSHYAWYGDPSAGNFLGDQQSSDAEKSGGTSVGPNSGQLTSPSLVIPEGASAASLEFETWFEIESVNPNDEGFDLMIVAVEDLSTGDLTQIARLNPEVDPELEDRTHIPFTSGGFNRRPVHRTVSLDLADYIGSEIRIVYLFDTVDNLYNGFRGWIVDDVQVREEDPVTPAIQGGLRIQTTPDRPVIGSRCGDRYCLDRPLSERDRSGR